MRNFFLIFFVPVNLFAQSTIRPVVNNSPLSKYSLEWNDQKYLVCNTAARVNFMTLQEKNVIYILNLARMNPKLFCNTVVKNYPEVSFYDSSDSIYYRSLMVTLNHMQPVNLLFPSLDCYKS